jgi:hypothetical protein
VNVWKVVCATLVIFVAGIVTGAVLVRLGERGPRPWNRPNRETINRPFTNPTVTNLSPQSNAARPNNPSPANNLGPLGREFVPALERELRLSLDQREQIQQVVKASQEQIRDLRLRIEPEVRAEMQKAQEQIRALLTTEQQEQYQRLMKRQHRRNEGGMHVDRRIRDMRNSRGPQPPLNEPSASTPDNPPPPEPEP